MTRLCVQLLLCGWLLSQLSACDDFSQPEDPVWNKQPCAHCHMLVSDPSFAGQLVTRRHERLFFDDPGCLADYMHAHPKDVEQAWVHDAASWSSARRARFRAGASSPMGYGFLASASGEHDFASVTRAAIGRRASGAP